MAVLQMNGVDYPLPASFDGADGQAIAELSEKVRQVVEGSSNLPALTTFQVQDPRSSDVVSLHVRTASVWSGMVSRSTS